MPSRRYFLKASVASITLLASGCAKPKHQPVSGLPDITIDIHTHIFNGRDIPATGFIKQVFLRDANVKVDENEGETFGFINLMVAILLAGTPNAEKELEKIQGNKSLRHRSLIAQDQKNVANGIRVFQDRLSQKSAFSASQSNRLMQRRLQNLYQDSGSNNILKSIQPDKSPDELAALIYSDREPAEPDTENKITQIQLVDNNKSLIQGIKWAGLLTRSRKGILSELKRLYKNRNTLTVFSPSILDFEYWFSPNDTGVSSISSQVELMSQIAKNETDVVLLNFVAFCPLRAAIDRRDGVTPSALDIVKDAVTKKGFAGVKLYPPMGFKPIGNNRATKSFGRKPNKKASGVQIDRELKALYRWCIEEGVPIKAHGNNSLAAQECSGENASPEFWGDVYKYNNNEFKGLHVNVAHFGGFEEELSPDEHCPIPKPNWEKLLAKLANKNPNFFADVGFWNEVMQGNDSTEVIKKTKGLFTKYTALENQIMYGSDWIMIGQLKNHESYMSDVKKALGIDLGLPIEKIMSQNAMRYLFIDHDSPQLNRLLTFFGKGHPFHKHFSRYKDVPNSSI